MDSAVGARICVAVLSGFLALPIGAAAQTNSTQRPLSRLLEGGVGTSLPRVVPNDNRVPAGNWQDGVLQLELEVVWADWRIETDDGPGLRVAALAESGKAPSVPAPLLRVDAGSRIHARIRNTLRDSSITVFGLQPHPAEEPDSLLVPPGETRTIEFEAGAAGTYLYWVRLGAGISPLLAEEEQLAGAFVVDPEGGGPPDRVFVINVFSARADTTLHPYGWHEALTINGLSWPHTERLHPNVGDTLRWRIVNASSRNHPMHLHGFYYDVTARGKAFADHRYEIRDRRKVVTELMRPRTTMDMQWIPTRPGNWLFHCHLSFHVRPEIRLPGTSGAGHGEHDVHMAGLVLGIKVQPGPTDLVSVGEPRHLTLHATEYAADSTSRFGFTLDPAFLPDSLFLGTPGPLLVLNQFQTTFATVENRMSVPTSVHWHGLELDAWSDGVPGWSASEGRVSPVIGPGESFTYKLSLMRPGTFIYHSHLDDVHQLTSGLYGPMIVLAPGETHDPSHDHVYIVGWRSLDPRTLADMELNGRFDQPEKHVLVGERHRIRLINIAPAGNITARMRQGERSVPLRALAKDGADLPEYQQVAVDVTPPSGVGETADFTFTPTEPGAYELVVGYTPEFSWHQTWVVSEPTTSLSTPSE